MEEEAESLSFQFLVKRVGGALHRETILSERGSVYSNIDRLAPAGNEWQQNNLPREYQSQPRAHKAFEPDTFPMQDKATEKNANQFVCDVLTKRERCHCLSRAIDLTSPMERRLQRIAEQLRPVAESLPTTPGDLVFTPIAVLQGDLGPIPTHIYHETGVYLHALQSESARGSMAQHPRATAPDPDQHDMRSCG